jgi:zinc protease
MAKILHCGTFVALLVASVTPAACADDREVQVNSFQLENGLSVLLRPIAGARQTAVVVLFDIGGDHDSPGRSGLAHLTEHLYVTAAAGQTPARDVASLIKASPHGWNAQTGDRYTVVAGVVPNDGLAQELERAAARMGDLRITEADLAREKPRVIEEVGNMFSAMPALAAMNNAREQVRPTPQGGRKAGVPEQVLAIRVEDVTDHWQRYYKPTNATLVVAGGFDVSPVKTQITQWFASLPRGEKIPEPADPGKSKFGEVPLIESLPILRSATSTAAVAYLAPSPQDRRYPAYLTLVARLYESDGPLAKLFGSGVQVVAPVLDDPAVVVLTTAVKGGETAEDAIARLDAHVGKAVAGGARPGEAARVRQAFGALLRPDTTSAFRPNVYGVAFAAGRTRQLGLDDPLGKALDDVTDDDLRQVAAELFGPTRRGAAFVRVSQSAPER